MSNEMLKQCWKLTIPQAKKFVLISLADQANDEGVCWPSVAYIMDRTSMSDRGVQNATTWLEERKAISVKKNAGPGGTNIYTLTPADFTPESDSPPNGVHSEPRSPPPESDSPLPRTTFTKPPNDVRPNHQEPSTNHQGTTISADDPDGASVKTNLTINDLMADGVTRQHAAEWLAIRKGKRQRTLTPTAWENLKTKAARDSRNPDQAIAYLIDKGWAGYYSESEGRHHRKPKPSAHTGFDSTDYKEDELEWNSRN